MKQNQWFAVRCCCTPKKVFGFIKLEAPNSWSFPVHRELVDNMGRRHPIKLLSIYVNKLYCGSVTERRNPDDIDDLTDSALCLIGLWLMIDLFVPYTILITMALTMGWFVAYRETLSDDGPR